MAPNPLHVLVVDDDPVVRQLHTAFLEHAGFWVTCVESGDEALTVVDGGDVELVLLDSRMPGMSGLDVLAAVRERGLALPVILVTGASDIDDRVEGLERGADDYITKPVDARELIARTRALLRGRQAAVDAASSTAGVDEATYREVSDVIVGRRFRPVFQPIVRLGDGQAVAFEALTRFDDGCRPDLRFIDAERVGLGAELAIATLTEAIRHADQLPRPAALHLNVSPYVLGEPALFDLLDDAGRDVVLELTEHDPIEDYAVAKERLQALGSHVRLAIDDAGAGYSSMVHVLALDPHEVKLDREWVRGVDVDVARQALIAGFVSFGAATDTVLVAEGIETEAEANVLRRLGVQHGQGFHLGRPEPAGYWAGFRPRLPVSVTQ